MTTVKYIEMFEVIAYHGDEEESTLVGTANLCSKHYDDLMQEGNPFGEDYRVSDAQISDVGVCEYDKEGSCRY